MFILALGALAVVVAIILGLIVAGWGKRPSDLKK